MPSDYSTFSDFPDKSYETYIITNKRYTITGTYCPTYTEYYVMATDSTNGENLAMYYQWTNGNTNIWTLTAHN